MRAALASALAIALAIVGGPSFAEAGPSKQVAQSKPAGKGRSKKPAKKAPKAAESKKAPRKAGQPALEADKAKRESVAGEPVRAPAEVGADVAPLKEVDEVLFPDFADDGAIGQGGAQPTQVVATGLPPRAEPASPDAQPSDLRWMASLAKPDIPFRWDARLVRYLDYFKNNARGRSFAAALIKRSGRYEAKIRAAAKAAGVPEDLVWVALVESGMNPRIVSHAGAAGLWQFMPKAATAYGLRMDKWVDERLDPERSTKAALKYLADLHARFGSWELALASYNMGHGALLSAIRKYNTNDFWELSQLEAGVPYETALYVPKIVALAFVARNKQVFGCDGVVVDPPEAFDVAVVGPGVSLDSVAGVSGSNRETLASLNPHLLADKTPPTSGPSGAGFTVRVPAGQGASVESKLPPPDQTDLVKHTIRWGESLEQVALASGTTESKIRSLNGISDTVPPRPGTVLLVPKPKAALPPAVAEPPVAVVPGRTPAYPDRRRVFYEVVWGDRIDDVARVLGVTVDELCQWNNVDRTARLHGKMVLQAFVPKKHELAGVRVLSASDTKVLVVGTPEFFDHFEAKNGRVRVVVTAQEGDTFASIAKRYGLTQGLLERINHKPRNASLRPGDQLVVYTRPENAKPAAPAVVPAVDKTEIYEDGQPVKPDLGG